MNDSRTIICLVLIVAAIAWYERDWWMPKRQTEVVYTTPAPVAVRHLAPPGTFYVVEYVSTHTPHGIAGFVPGQEVRFVSADEAKRMLLVTDGKYQVEVTPIQITNDMDIAAIARRQDQDSQHQLQVAQEAAAKADEKSRQQIDIEHAKRVAKIGSGAAIGGDSALDEKARAASHFDRTREQGYGSPYSYFHQGYYLPVTSP